MKFYTLKKGFFVSNFLTRVFLTKIHENSSPIPSKNSFMFTLFSVICILLCILSFGFGQESEFSQENEMSYNFFFKEDFSTQVFIRKSWFKSSDKKYQDQLVSVGVNKELEDVFPDDKALFLESESQHYAIAKPFDENFIIKEGEDLVFQFELALGSHISCGGAYVKLLRPYEDGDIEEYSNEFPYSIMFGPDKCGQTNKIHFIVQHQNPLSKEWEEKHMTKDLRFDNDKIPHLYTLIIRSNDDFEILLDGETKFSGSLNEDVNPPFSSPEMIDDPSDLKPEDWEDEEEIEDAEASKPEGFHFHCYIS